MEDNTVPLRPKARILKTLGEELISSDVVAIIELVKNSYDADAQCVLINFDAEDSIIVSDNGCGMDLQVIRDSWMTIATPHKKSAKNSSKYNRRYLGEKGIGRFSSSKLANELELISRPMDGGEEVYVYFDWAQFDQDLFLDEIQFLTEIREPSTINEEFLSDIPDIDRRSGTVLQMSGLKNSWGDSDFNELDRGLSRLISPFKEISDFEIFVKKPNPSGVELTRVEAPEIIKFPHYTLKGCIEADGKFEIIITVEEEGKDKEFDGYFYQHKEGSQWKVRPLDKKLLDVPSDEFREIECGAFTFELRVWDRDDLGNIDQKVGGGIRSIRQDLDAIAGINIYRDGFRVLPYGEPNNDWLRLDMRRVQTPAKRLSNNQITGYISISADENPRLHDRSNREGLDSNRAYHDLEQIMVEILAKFEGIRYLARRPEKIQRDGSKDPQKGLFDEPNLSSLKDVISSDDTDKKVALNLVDEFERSWKTQIKSFKDVLSQYHSLATLGGIVDKVLHDGRQPLASIQIESGLGKEAIEDFLEESGLEDIDGLDLVEKSFERITSQASILRQVFNRVEPFGGRKKGRPKKYYIEDLIRDNFDIYRKEINSLGVNLELPQSQTLVSLDVTELSEIFTNLITNSIYWISQVEVEARYIYVDVNRLDDGALEILFSDSGPGVDSEIKNRIFEPYVSGRSDGHGLGLSLVGEIVKSYYDGSVELLNSDVGALFRIVMRKRV